MKIAIWHFTDTKDKTIYMPLGIRYLKSYALEKCKQKHEIHIINNIDELDLSYDIVAISCMSQDFSELKKYLEIIKDRNIEIWIGGYHISWMPETLPKEIKVGIRFEGEEIFRELVDLKAEYKELTPNILKDVKGIVYHDGERCIINERRELIKNMDEIPFPDREEGIMPYWRKKHNIFSSRGCPFSCVFCSSTKYWQKFRAFSAEYVVNEVESIIKNFPECREITFVDDLFTADKKRLREIINIMKKRNILGKVMINMSLRIDLVDQELCDMLKEINSNFIYFGMESANNRILSYLKNSTQTREKIKRGLEILKQNNIPISTSFIIGTPSETEEELRETYEFLVESMQNGLLNEVAANILSPMPGTKLWNECIDKGIIGNEIDWSRFKYYSYTHTEKYFSMPIDEWFNLRKNSNSLFINTDMGEDYTYKIMKEYDKKIKEIFVKKLMEKYKISFNKYREIINNYSQIVIVGVSEISYILTYIAQYELNKNVIVYNNDNKLKANYILKAKVVNDKLNISPNSDSIVIYTVEDKEIIHSKTENAYEIINEEFKKMG